MEFDVITIFPEIIEAPLSRTILRRALDRGLLSVRLHALRDFADPPHRKVDDQPYGGGGGMILKPEPIFRAVEHIKSSYPRQASRTILMSPQGRPLQHREAVRLSLFARLILICGRYEGVDDRVRTSLVDEEISIGDYVLTGGELPAMVLMDAVTRLVPGVVGEGESVLRDSFVDGMLQYPQYTRPAAWQGLEVPEVLRSGRHEEIAAWRREKSESATRRLRPDLLGGGPPGEGAEAEAEINENDSALLEER
jgi:tRNA (guanine37-N1)-methyltransferase